MLRRQWDCKSLICVEEDMWHRCLERDMESISAVCQHIVLLILCLKTTDWNSAKMGFFLVNTNNKPCDGLTIWDWMILFANDARNIQFLHVLQHMYEWKCVKYIWRMINYCFQETTPCEVCLGVDWEVIQLKMHWRLYWRDCLMFVSQT